jgi:hypothetical protein
MEASLLQRGLMMGGGGGEEEKMQWGREMDPRAAPRVQIQQQSRSLRSRRGLEGASLPAIIAYKTRVYLHRVYLSYLNASVLGLLLLVGVILVDAAPHLLPQPPGVDVLLQ